MEQHFDMVVIGFGKAGKTLAGAYAKTGKNVALIEQSDKMYGGTCINIGCVPTKALVARSEAISGGPTKAWDDAVAFRGKLTEAMRGKNKEILESNETAKLITGHARFLSDTEVEVTAGDDVLKLTADYFIINTGATPVIPDVQGLKESKHVYTFYRNSAAHSAPGVPRCYRCRPHRSRIRWHLRPFWRRRHRLQQQGRHPRFCR